MSTDRDGSGGSRPRAPRKRGWAGLASAVAAASVLAACGSGGGGGGASEGPPPPLAESREFRAIAGVSMGGYGALNLGTKHADVFGAIASLGGPVDLTQLLQDSVEDGLEVKPETTVPRAVGEDFTFDHLPPYPDRDSRISLFQDLMLAFGNPFLHHPDPSHAYLAVDSEPARLRVDDRFGSFTVPASGRGFLDGGDANMDGLRESGETPTQSVDVLLAARGSLAMLAPDATPVLRGERALADLDGDGVFDVGDGIVVNLSEPFADANGNLVFEPELGETFEDLGLDGVPDSGDFGEGNGIFDYDPDRAHWLAEDPLTRLAARSAGEIATQRIYMDVGTEDEFGFARHYAHLVDLLVAKGLQVAIQDGFPRNCADLSGADFQLLLVRYPAGHVGVERVDPADLLNGDVCGNATVWQRIISMIGFLNQSFPDGFFGPGDGFSPPDVSIDFPNIEVHPPDINLDPTGDVVRGELPSPALTASGGGTPMREILVYRPPAYFRSDASFPIVYFLGGYGQTPGDYERIQILLDALILTGQLQNMYFAFLPGAGGHEGSFYVNHVVPESQAPGVPEVTSGRYEDSIFQDLIPVIENQILKGRMKRP
jgi:Putative esterase